MPENKNSTDTLCVLPWRHFIIDNRGALHLCCQTLSQGMPNVDETGRTYRIQDLDSLDEAWNSAFMKQVRQEMLTGQRPQPCHQCYLAEDHGIESYRQLINERYSDELTTIRSTAAADGSAPPIVRSWEVMLGNQCNLRCRMCFPMNSRGLIVEWEELYEDWTPFSEQATQQFKWYQQDEFWRRFDYFTRYIDRLHFAGGEPFLVPEMFTFLERLIELDRAPNIAVTYNTNFTVLPERLFNLWPHFRLVRLVASIDGYDEINSFIRYPADWQRIDRNLRFLNANSRRVGVSQLGFNTVVQVYNIFYLDQLFAYILDNLEQFDPYPILSLLETPSCFSIQILPPELKEIAAARLQAFQAQFSKRWPDRAIENESDQFLQHIDGVIQHMMARDRQELIPEFVRQSQFFDRNRGQKTVEVVPELAPLLAMAEVM
ncbi:MAG: twitch domain-containing radical SAM protein [Candidatus Promineifilaceae bacterium]|nr:twitch domain-containing radical SAM protein [Candidatus Promineifilaceae bacterium]